MSMIHPLELTYWKEARSSYICARPASWPKKTPYVRWDMDSTAFTVDVCRVAGATDDGSFESRHRALDELVEDHAEELHRSGAGSISECLRNALKMIEEEMRESRSARSTAARAVAKLCESTRGEGNIITNRALVASLNYTRSIALIVRSTVSASLGDTLDPERFTMKMELDAFAIPPHHPAAAVATTPPASADIDKARAGLDVIGIDLDKLIEASAPAAPAPVTGAPLVSTAAFCCPGLNESFSVPRGSAWWRAYKIMDEAHAAGQRINTMITGPTGCGKTEGAMHYAATRERPILVVDCTQLHEPSDAFGAMVAESGSTKFVPAPLVDALQTRDAIVCLDEVNRSRAKVLNSLFSILDGRGSARLDCLLDEDGKPIDITVASNVNIMLTANIGASYRGTGRLDAAFSNRSHGTVRVDYLTQSQERKLLMKRCGIGEIEAGFISAFTAWTRKESGKLTGGLVSTGVSTRRAINCAEFVARGQNVDDALAFGIVDSLDTESERTAASAQIKSLIGGA